MTHQYKSEVFLPVDIITAWDFFSSAKNLAKITPPEMDFKILTELGDTEVYEGMIIDYTVKPLFGLALKWQTEICIVTKPSCFTDRQVKGPYSLWEHTHSFSELDGGVLMKDEVKYKLPLGFVGDLVNYLIVEKKITNIFKYREGALNRIFKTSRAA
jgi:ligand-binding SRPBCC domain-containing protein